MMRLAREVRKLPLADRGNVENLRNLTAQKRAAFKLLSTRPSGEVRLSQERKLQIYDNFGLFPLPGKATPSKVVTFYFETWRRDAGGSLNGAVLKKQ